MSRLKRILALTAALVAGGVAVEQAIKDTAKKEGVGKEDLCKGIVSLDGVRHTRFIVTNGPLPGEAFGDYVFGECAKGVCDYPYTGSPCGWKWSYERFPAVSGWRLFKFSAPEHIAEGLKFWAENTSGVRWLGGMGELKSACLTNFTAKQCSSFLQTHKCWKLGNGNICRNGFEYGPGIGERTGCGPDVDAVPWPCHSNQGAGFVDADATHQHGVKIDVGTP